MLSDRIEPIEQNYWFKLPAVIGSLVMAQKAVRAHYNSYENDRLSFTLDGNLVGDIGEALAIEEFGLEIHPPNGEGVDGTAGGLTVQVKATGTGRGPAFRHTKVDAKHLLFFQIDFESSRARVVYNGPEAAVRALLKAPWVGQKSLSMSQIEKLDRSVLDQDRLRRTTMR
jgi:hypothetical protein